MEILEDLLPYQGRLESRDTIQLDLIVLHCTELPTLQMARDFAEKIAYEESGTGTCGHYYVERDGRINRWVRDDRIAHHVAGHNQTSIGIELVNTGRYPNWFSSDHQIFRQSYPAAQIT